MVWSCDHRRRVTLKGQGHYASNFETQYHDNGCRYSLVCNGRPIGNVLWGIEWSHDRWCHAYGEWYDFYHSGTVKVLDLSLFSCRVPKWSRYRNSTDTELVIDFYHSGQVPKWSRCTKDVLWGTKMVWYQSALVANMPLPGGECLNVDSAVNR